MKHCNDPDCPHCGEFSEYGREPDGVKWGVLFVLVVGVGFWFGIYRLVMSFCC